MRNVRILPLHPRLAITVLIVLLVAGCQGRLAQQDDFFSPFSGVATAVKDETERLVTYHEALHALRLFCTSKGLDRCFLGCAFRSRSRPGSYIRRRSTAGIVYPLNA